MSGQAAVAGYDEATRLLLLEPPKLPPMPERPTKADAAAALLILDRLLDEFPFTGAASRTVALSMLITPVVRVALKAVPLQVTTAPVAGSGKSYIVDISCCISTGQPAPGHCCRTEGRGNRKTRRRRAP
jgi:putative DNA primase/helicase